MRFTKDHEWVELDGDTATVGVTAYAADQLGDVVFVETLTVGDPSEVEALMDRAAYEAFLKTL